MNDGLLFWARYVTLDGRTGRGLRFLATSDEVTAKLLIEQRFNAVVISLWALPAWLSSVWMTLLPLWQRPWPTAPLSEFLHSLGVMLKSGIPIDLAVRELTQEIKDTALRAFSQELHANVQAGQSVSVCLDRHATQLPPTVVALITVGERTGTLDESLIQAGEHVKRLGRLRQDIVKALIYPLFALTTITVAVLFWVFYVLPHMSSMFKQMGAELPPYTRAAMQALQWVSELQGPHIWLWAAILAFIAGVIFRQSQVRLWVARLLLKLPISGPLIQTAQLALITEQLSLLIRAGLPMDEALKVLSMSIRHSVYRTHLEVMRHGVARGHALSRELARCHLFPSMVIRMTTVGEQSGTLDRQLSILAEEYRRRLDHAISTLSEILKPLLLVIAGAVFVMVVVVFLLPIYHLISQVMN